MGGFVEVGGGGDDGPTEGQRSESDGSCTTAGSPRWGAFRWKSNQIDLLDQVEQSTGLANGSDDHERSTVLREDASGSDQLPVAADVQEGQCREIHDDDGRVSVDAPSNHPASACRVQLTGDLHYVCVVACGDGEPDRCFGTTGTGPSHLG